MEPIEKEKDLGYKRLTPDDISKEGMINLIQGIVRQSVHDYKLMLRHGSPSMIAGYEQFFTSRWFEHLTGLNGQYIIEKARRDNWQEMEDDEDD